jgi:hypothetical protein
MKLTVLLLSAMAALTHAQFEEVEISRAQDDSSSIRGVVFPAICYGQFDNVPQAMYTVRTSPSNDDTVRVFSNPPGLVEAGVDPQDGLIYLKFSEVVQDTAEGRSFDAAGVVIEFPPDQLEVVMACCGQTVQIQDGFTNVRDLIAHSGATVYADFGTGILERLTADVRDEALLNMNVNTQGGGGSAVVTVRRAKVEINGDLRILDCADNSECILEGTVTNNGRAISSSTIAANGCDNVSGTCDVSDPTVTIDTSRSLTMTGQVETCVQFSQLVERSFLTDGQPVVDDDNLPNDDITDDVPPVEDDRFEDDRFQEDQEPDTDEPDQQPDDSRSSAMSLMATSWVAALAGVAAVLLM